MSEVVQKVLLLPRFSSFVGAGPFYTAPMNIRTYQKAFITGWRGTGVGPSPGTATITIQESTDLGVWIDNAVAIGPPVNSEVTQEVVFSLEWMRLKIDLTGSFAAMTMWAVGNFVAREE